MRNIFAFAVFALVLSGSAHARDFGVVMDLSGKAALAGKKGAALDLGKNIVVGDVISLKEKASVTVVSYQGCEEWRIGGPASVTFTAEKPEPEKGSKGTVAKGRKLPVCYKPADVQASSHEQGGLVLMNKAVPQDQMEGPAPVEMSGTAENEEITKMRQAFSGGKADNAALMTLVMYDLQRRDMESARPYYAELKRRAPASAFVKRMGAEFGL
ncbi:MAG: hypothetical protein HZA04_10045 [Nitrospinae bacterium]|nr:hypothetical protein [Nitrospinota bacterium]